MDDDDDDDDDDVNDDDGRRLLQLGVRRRSSSDGGAPGRWSSRRADSEHRVTCVTVRLTTKLNRLTTASFLHRPATAPADDKRQKYMGQLQL